MKHEGLADERNEDGEVDGSEDGGNTDRLAKYRVLYFQLPDAALERAGAHGAHSILAAALALISSPMAEKKASAMSARNRRRSARA